jgi:acetyl esterase/lipase
MPLHPTVAAVVEAARKSPDYRPMHALSPADARTTYRQFGTAFGAGPELPAVHDLAFAGPGGQVPLRVYRSRADGPEPTLLYMHGGGWVIGDLESHDWVCRFLCKAAGCAVVAVDYRLAPEHPHPAAHADCWAALEWLVADGATLGLDTDRIAVGGDSAGGNLAAGLCLRARRQGGPALRAQALIYPAVSRAVGDFGSHQENAEGPFLELETMRYFLRHYLGSDEYVHSDPIDAPVLAADVSGLPPAVVVTAEYDPLRDEGNAYAAQLGAAGVPTKLIEGPGLPHAFIHLAPIIDEARAPLEQIAATLSEAFK